MFVLRECLSLAGFSSLNVAGKARSKTYSGAPERCFTQVGSYLTQKHLNKLERFARDKHSSLLQIFINHGCKKFYIIGPSVRIHKTFLNN
jgi:hypothetical protein